jgi:antitoxin (DNA-binding transcriptional repressor) of toxin-antitoxin stability system
LKSPRTRPGQNWPSCSEACRQASKRYTITLRGEPVADLVPAEGSKQADAAAAVDAMRKFMRAAPRAHGIDLKLLIDEGRA